MPSIATKRPAEEALEKSVDSPSSKRARTNGLPLNGVTYSQTLPQRTIKAFTQEVNDQLAGDDILAAADEEAELLGEADPTLSPPPPPPPDDDEDGMLEDADEDDDDPEMDLPVMSSAGGRGRNRQHQPDAGFSDLYLDTIDRSVLDFDFEKLCSVSLSNINVYACLVCGKYFQGRGTKSHAYTHSLDGSNEDTTSTEEGKRGGHHVFVNLETKSIWVLPEGYEVKGGRGLEDIKYVVDPRFTKEEVKRLDKDGAARLDLQGKPYRPGYIGMNNIKANDYFNVIIQSLSHVPPIRDFFLLNPEPPTPHPPAPHSQPPPPASNPSKPNPASQTLPPQLLRQLPIRLSTLLRKLWCSRLFKAHISPHEALQLISLLSHKQFTPITQSDPAALLSWLLNTLHLSLGGSRTRPGSSTIQRTFQGRLRIESQQIAARADQVSDRLRFEPASGIATTTSPFLVLTLDLPPQPLFQDQEARNIIPQVPLSTLLGKYDGVRTQELLGLRRRYRLLHPLPPYLLMHVKRFRGGKFGEERNGTIVTFPATGLDLGPFVDPNSRRKPDQKRTDLDPDAMDLGTQQEPIFYDLVANVVHEAVRRKDDAVEGEAPGKSWRAIVRDKAGAGVKEGTGWWEIQDLDVKAVQGETLFLGESYIMVWERRRG